MHDKRFNLVHRADGHDGQTGFRSHAVHCQQLLEKSQRIPVVKTEQGHTVVLHLHIRIQLNHISLPSIQHRRGIRHVNPETDSALRLHHDGSFLIKKIFSRNMSNHPITLLFLECAWQMAAATASAVSSGFGTSFKFRITLTIFCTCFFSARP